MTDDAVAGAPDRWSLHFTRSLRPQAVLDDQGRLVEVNDAYCRMIGHPREDLVGRPVVELNHPDDTGEADQAVRRLLSGELPAVQVQRVMVRADGSPLPVLLDVVAEHDAQGRVTGTSAFVHDLRPLLDLERQRREQDALFQALNRRASDLALVTDAHGRVLYASPAVRNVLGHDQDAVVRTVGWDFAHPDDVPAALEEYERTVREGGATTFRVRLRNASGQWRCMQATVTNLLDTAVGGMICNLRDITEQVEAERDRRRLEGRYRAIAETAQEGILAVDTAGETLYANQRLADLLGLDLRELYEADPARLLLPEEADEVRERVRTRPLEAVDRYEVGYAHPDGRRRRFVVATSPLRDEHGAVEGRLAMVSDVTQERQAEEELRHAVLHDPLTGLPNRALLLDRLEHALTREGVGTGVVALSLDQFTLVNDAHGHLVGDALLVAVAERLRRAARPQDTVGRLGGDAFVVVCEDVDEADTHVLAQELLAGVTGTLELEGVSVHVRASAGVAVGPGTASDLLRFADAALRSAKQGGGGRVRLFHLPLAEEAERRARLSADLRTALAPPVRELHLHHQPLVDLQTGCVVGLEALARWDSSVHGPVQPEEFVPVAEAAGLAQDLDGWSVQGALREARTLLDAGAVPQDVQVAVNLSVRTLHDGRLSRVLQDAVEEHGFAPERVVLELTETAMMEDAEATAVLLSRLRERGFKVVADDFGTGYSSLAYVRQLPLTAIKIDRSFVTAIDSDTDALAVVASVVDLARAVGVDTVAEGVETERQAALLRRLGCTAGQGFLWSRPVPVAQVLAAPWTGGFPVPAATRPRAPKRPTVTVGPEHGLDRLMELHRSGASLATIAAALNREGFRTPSGSRWKHNSVANAVADVAYPGLAEDEG